MQEMETQRRYQDTGTPVSNSKTYSDLYVCRYQVIFGQKIFQHRVLLVEKGQHIAKLSAENVIPAYGQVRLCFRAEYRWIRT